MRKIFQSVGPALIVAAVVLGPGSILMSSVVGAKFGLVGFGVVVLVTILLIGMVALSARLGAVYEDSLCTELAKRLGRPAAVTVGMVLFLMAALFQSSNNIALVGGLEPMLSSTESVSFGVRVSIIVAINCLVIGCLYCMQNLYRFIESGMKVLIGLMALAFIVNFFIVFSSPVEKNLELTEGQPDWLPIIGLIGTTFSVAGAFYQAYLVKEKGWGINEVKRGLTDSILSTSILGLITAIILLASWRVFYGQEISLKTVDQIARQLEPSFGSASKMIFCIGILAGALSSFMVNAIIGGTVLSDSMGKGSRLKDRWPLHLSTLALVIGMLVAIGSFYKEGSTVHLITLAQALTVIGVPALALALIYLGSQTELKSERKIPRPLLALALVGLLVSCVVACFTINKVYRKMIPQDEKSIAWRQPVAGSLPRLF
ncbi:MAG: divalent metal cation transporter [Planctomycetota bacterium]|nr:divalent metal cation transporter [Planctomycetota bacterium]